MAKNIKILFNGIIKDNPVFVILLGMCPALATTSSSIIGKNPETTKFEVTNDGGDIDAISASTITSRAFLEAVRRAYAAYTESENYTSTGATIAIEDEVTEIKEN